MKYYPRRLKYIIWLYFVLFALGIMCVVWFLQLVLANRYFYQTIESSMITTGRDISVYYGNMIGNPNNDKAKEDYEASIENARAQRSFQVFVANGDDIYTVGNEYNGVIGSAYAYYIGHGGPEDGYCDVLPNEAKEELYVYINRIGEEDGSPVYLVLIRSLQSIKDTSNMMQRLLGIITLVVIVIALVISIVISASLANPLSKMTSTAKRLARGDFNVKFSGSEYAEIRELADTLNAMKEELMQTAILQRELLANVTHDLKTPLTMVKAYAEMIRDFSGENKEKRNKHAQVIIDEADRLTMLVNDILNLSKVQSGMDGLEIERINLSKLLSTVIDRFSSFLESNGYTINSQIESGLFAECDAKKIEQVFYNLIGNAINYTGENKTVEVFLTVNDGKILFEVIDSGKGIAEDKIDTIWVKYYRASDTHQRPVKGTGLGLSIVKAILEVHGFRYGVISRKGEGSNFFVEFPQSKG